MIFLSCSNSNRFDTKHLFMFIKSSSLAVKMAEDEVLPIFYGLANPCVCNNSCPAILVRYVTMRAMPDELQLNDFLFVVCRETMP